MKVMEQIINTITKVLYFYVILALWVSVPVLSDVSTKSPNTLPLSNTAGSSPASSNEKIKSDVIKPYTANLKGSIKGLPLSASGSRTLKKNSAGIWELTFDASAGIFLKIKEVSSFNLVAGLVKPETYQYIRSGIFGSKKEQKANFDWAQSRISWQKNDKHWENKLQVGTLDNLSYQINLRIDLASGKKDLNYLIAEGDEVYQRSLTVEAEEMLQVDLGKIRTVRVKVNRDNNRRETYIWYAKDWDYFFVKLLQKEDGSEYSIEIVDATIDGKIMKGG